MNKIAVKAISLCLSAAMLSGAFLPSAATNVKNADSIVYAEAGKQLLENSTCETTNGWGMYLAGGADAELSAKNGELDVHVNNVGTLNYGVQLNYAIIPLYKNGVYRLSYDIYSDVERYGEAMIQMNGGDYTSYVWTDVNITTEKQTITKEFEMEYDSDICSKLCFNLGNQKKDAAKNLGEHHIYVDNVHIEIVDDSKVDYSVFKTEETPILTNQVGYLTDAKKIAVLRGEGLGSTFSVVDAKTNEEVYKSQVSDPVNNISAQETNYYADFSKVTAEGTYYITCGDAKSYEFKIGKDVYNDLLEESVYMLYTQRCGTEINDEIAAHPACHDTMAVIYGTQEKIDVTGGWHDAGDYGRYVVPAAKTIADLFYAYDTDKSLFTDTTGIPESGNGVADILDEARYELEWMLKMQDKNSGGVYHKVSCYNFPSYCMPQEETDQLVVTPISTTATADFCAAMAMAYEYFNDVDAAFANKCLDAAKSAWAYLEKHQSYELVNPKDVTTGDYADFKKNDTDERFWAAAQMFRATGESKYEEAISKIGVKTGLGWSDMGTYGSFAYLTMDSSKQNADIKARIEQSIISQADDLMANVKSNPYGESLEKYFWGCNMDTANGGMILSLAEKIDQTTDSEKGYAEAAAEQLNYLLGKNPLGTCFVTGFGTVSPKTPHHRPSMKIGQAVPGMLVGGPDSALEDDTAKAFLKDAAPAKCYIDNAESYSTNEVTIYWNSPLTALIADVLSAKKADTPVEPPVTTTTATEPTTTTTTTELTTTTTATEPTTTTTVTEPTTTTTSSETTSQLPAEEFMYGDFDGDKIADINDLTMLSLYLLKDVKFDDVQLKAADVDGNGTVELADLPHFKQYLVKAVDKLGPRN